MRGVWAGALVKRGKPLARRTPLRQGESKLKRGAPKARPKRRTADEATLRGQWARVAGGKDGHHALRRSVIERLAGEAGLPVAETAWDLRWMVRLDREVHERHTNRSRRLPFSVVPPAARAAAHDLDGALRAADRPATAYSQLEREYVDG